MLTITVQDILTKDTDEIDPTCEPCCIYLVRDEMAVLYVGRSNDPINRLAQHFGIASRSGGAALGVFYQEHKEQASTWLIDLYTLDDCELLLEKVLSVAWKAELAMIQHFHPCLNRTNNPDPGVLPERYRRISKLNLDNNAVDVLNF